MEQEKNQTEKMLKQRINPYRDNIHTLEDIPDGKVVYLDYATSSTSVSVRRNKYGKLQIVIYNAKNQVDIKISKDELEKIKLGVY